MTTSLTQRENLITSESENKGGSSGSDENNSSNNVDPDGESWKWKNVERWGGEIRENRSTKVEETAEY